MTLQHLKNDVETICLANKNIQTFDYGEDFQLAIGKGKKYPMAFMELRHTTQDYSFDQDNFENRSVRAIDSFFKLWEGRQCKSRSRKH